MKQYLELLKAIESDGDDKAPARENMPGTRSLFGYQMEFDLLEGFPIVTTKEVNFNHILIELLWFLKKDQNIKYMVDRGVNIWNEDAYNYFQKLFPDSKATFKEFVERVKGGYTRKGTEYRYGDTGSQYPIVWRDITKIAPGKSAMEIEITSYDQIKELINKLNTNPEGRRHLVSAVDIANQDDLALFWCHVLFQFNCRKMTTSQRVDYLRIISPSIVGIRRDEYLDDWLDSIGAPEYYLDCKLYQRSADVILGVPYNISSYALLTNLISSITNMAPGKFIHTFGDVHLYDNHREAIGIQLQREPRPLPQLMTSSNFLWATNRLKSNKITLDEFFDGLNPSIYSLENYSYHGKIKAKLNTGMVNKGVIAEKKVDDIWEAAKPKLTGHLGSVVIGDTPNDNKGGGNFFKELWDKATSNEPNQDKGGK